MRTAIGVLAHVDAGKTTFSEQLLYRAHSIRRLGRVDHGDTLLDNHPIERARGITVFSGTTDFSAGGREFALVDTPGHADFAGDMERAASILDCAVVLVSAVEGIESHTLHVWHLLEKSGIPVLFFLNKTDRAGADAQSVLRDIRLRFTGDAVPADPSALREAAAERDEEALAAYLAGRDEDAFWWEKIRSLVASRRLFPVFTGSALTGDGMDDFLAALPLVAPAGPTDGSRPFSALCWKVARDTRGVRMCFLKALTGTLTAKTEIALSDGAAKPGEIRVYRGDRFETRRTVSAGELFSVTGLASVHAGDRIGLDAKVGAKRFTSEPMMASSVTSDVPAGKLLEALGILEDEDPSLRAEYREQDGSISLCVLGEMQLEIARQILRDRFGIVAAFGAPRVLYRETIAGSAIGIGHFEPLRHYAEVWLRLVPTGEGTGITFASLAHVDDLALNWQRLIGTHVLEKRHKGVLTGAPLTDVRVELIAGRAHPKHTEGGDFREAVYRAIRNGLMRAKCLLLEPMCRFTVTYPAFCFGAVSGSLARLRADCEHTPSGDGYITRGEARLSAFSLWQRDFASLTRGRGSCVQYPSRYIPAENAEEIIAQSHYDPLSDDTPNSVFCAKGAGYTVMWDQIERAAHLHPEL